MASHISIGASVPWTAAGAMRISTDENRLPVIFNMSLMAAPEGEVTMPIFPGRKGSILFV